MRTLFLLAKLRAVLGTLAVGVFTLLGFATSNAQTPSKVGMLFTEKVRYDSTAKLYSVELTFLVGEVNALNPAPNGFVIKRGIVGQISSEESYTKIKTIEGVFTEGQQIFCVDNTIKFRSGYDYLIRPFIANGTDTIWGQSRTYMTCVPSGYCISMSDPQVRFVTDAPMLAIPGETYIYESFAQHRSFRVQGMVRYEILEGPEGMTIDPLSGKLTWSIPSEQTGNVFIKIRAYSLDSKTAEAFQQWYLTFATTYDLKIGKTSSVNEDVSSQTGLHPNPVTGSLMSVKTSAFAGTQISMTIINSNGETVYSLTESMNSSNDVLTLPTASLSNGHYLARITNGTRTVTTPFVVIR